jgi:hypothetical protein
MAIAHKEAGSTEQATAALWIAHAQLQHYIDGQLSNQGLSSGERDTARDNTMLHNMYAKRAAFALKTRMPGWRPAAYTAMCGDDEIAIGMSWADGVAYVIEHEEQGHAVQHRKMMISTGKGEFLQYNMYSGDYKVPTQPLAPALNNFVSGSWYKTAAYQTADYPQQVSEAAASCIRRGARRETMCLMAISTCNWLCHGYPWKNALRATNLFGATKPKPHTTTTQYTDPKQLAAKTKPAALTEYTAHIATRFQLNSRELATVAQFAAGNIFATYLADIRDTSTHSDDHDDNTRITWPPQITADPKVVGHWHNSPATDRTDAKTWLAVQLGLPLPLIATIGMAKIIARATNQMRAHINLPTPNPQLAIEPVLMAAMPGALAPYYRTTTTQVS